MSSLEGSREAAAACGACGGTALRPARSRTGLHRRVRACTPLERYACGTCGHRGWRVGKLPGSEAPGDLIGRRAPGGRRDRGASPLPPIAMALALGAATAWFVLRMAAGRP